MAATAEWTQIGGRVRQARLGRAMSQADLGDRVGLDRSALTRVEAGDRRITALELLSIADCLHVPMSWFLEEPLPAVVSMRTPLDEQANPTEAQQFTADVALEQAWRDVEQLQAGGYLQPVQFPARAITDQESAAELARMARSRLGLEDEPLPPLADVAAGLGLHITVMDDEMDGASLTPTPGFGVAIVGGRSSPGRRRMTAAHEIGHHVTGDEYASDVGVATSRDARERLIDAFAHELLLPTAVLQVVPVGGASIPELRKHLIRIGAAYRVSWSASVRGLQRVAALPDDVAQDLIADPPLRGDFLRVVGADVPEDLQVGTSSSTWRQAVMAAYEDGFVMAPRALELLRDPSLGPQDLPEPAAASW
ncbi:helix-turn-helix domain-containing protein [Mobilicoccus caccae]|uniref:HTH cro/C1-type domain-containing protein n=1 Tax=Mobilicoccus caccae TaxID=1859295 RepID=A0ABQ6IKE3_9MICO|nr:XRE family transcriptional regulator [Mobilicoccus caccae]GMA38216.1 hypothetical protein GCM10025883_02610 [Mobilicoccus caccae]